MTDREQVEQVKVIMGEVKRKAGRPSVMTEDTIRKIEEGALLGLKNKALCLYADIGTTAFYEYLKQHADFAERLDILRHNPSILAMQAVNKGLTDRNKTERYKMSRWYLEKTDPDFSNKHDVSLDTTGSLSIESRSDALSAFLRRFDPE